ncbi:NAD(P)-binding protein [Schizophyllum commune Tattone D]|nr:NAD(P)-binding protein [Schizophyllum commune Tattone D]
MGNLSFPRFLWDQLSYHAPVVRKDLKGQTVVVVGANVGLGYEAAKHFATMGAERVIMACRSKERGAAAVERAQKETGLNNTELMLVDLADFSSIKNFVAELQSRVERLDILVLNAGVAYMRSNRVATKDGWEGMMQVNVISPSILALLLLPLMVRTSRERHTIPRTVIVTSSMHYYVPPYGDDIFLQPELLKAISDLPEYDPMARYCESKLFNVFFIRALAERLRSTHPTVIVNSVNPGLATTTLTRDAKPSDMPISLRIMHATIAVTAEVGSRELVYAALAGSERAGSLQGAYVDRCEVREPSDFVVSEKGRIAQDRTFREIVAAAREIEPKIDEILKEYLLDI